MFRSLPLLCFFFSSVLLHAEVREWKSADGSRSFKGEYVSRDGDEITIKRTTGGEITFAIEKLHSDDQKWIEANFPIAPKVPESSSVFGNLNFGDTHDAVYEKLKDGTLVETLPEVSVFGSMGLTDNLKTKVQLGGLDCFITFGWADDDTLNEINLKTSAISAQLYQTKLKEVWEECTQLISALHGNPVQAADLPDSAAIPAEMAVGTHLWKLENGGSAMVGITRKNSGFAILIRFTQESMIPASDSSEE
ncbi:hypothetical protein JIN85_16515 [Luteolibacter pohnpeiensis]|uniref:SLA1 homology domain-containing protein n=1 Tax=Luteolibacter pohnpeiensis TaxID=454153 RepID=A0A934S9U7_9BACT|nr:hypothetical protein [Luteolibacter pohnpeiensis]MBK1884025.1 hypothetical protein [Luteolibacter pohnpeiensis]